MKIKTLLLAALALLIGTFATAQDTAYYGEKINKKRILSTKKFSSKIADQDSLTDIKLKGEILDTCPMKGCWMKVRLDDNSEMMVKFKDYGFFVPKGLKEGNTIVRGKAIREVTSVAELKHLAEDAGKSKEEIDAITAPKERVVFYADGVIIE
ncbi:DUF4920 domain-containing protein [Algivirga pacifica]|uniref:DUF4920 domain-containing protein n=1 Tax=Algivirga pacifica TaxID=1162670 RepID=A0ABP9D0D6_9BACT